jgi:hypothetical protein
VQVRVVDALIEKNNSTGATELTYRFPVTVSRFEFSHRSSLARKQQWHPDNDSFTLDEDGHSVVSKRPLSVFRFRLAPSNLPFIREHDPLVSFSDGSVLVFGGYIELDANNWKTRLTIRQSSNHEVVLHSNNVSVNTFKAVIQMNCYQRCNTYFYLGSNNLRRYKSANFLLDPSLPSWIRELLSDISPKLLQFYSQQVGRSPQVTPLIAVSMNGLKDEGTNHWGDAIDRKFIRLTLYGSGWNNHTEENRVKFLKFLAHELFHIWNADSTINISNENEWWLLEGSADYAAITALVESGAVKHDWAIRELTLSINRCAIGLKGQSLSNAISDRARNRVAYDCGAALYFLADSKTRQQRTRDSKFFQMFSSIDHSRNASVLSFAAYARLDAGDSIATFILDVSNNHSREFSDRYLALAPTGLLESDPETEILDASVYIQELFSQVLGQDCSAGFGYWRTEAGYKVDSNMGCASFNSFPVIIGIDGHDFSLGSRKAYDAAQRACSSRTPAKFAVAGQEKPIEWTCKTDIRALPAGVKVIALTPQRLAP